MADEEVKAEGGEPEKKSKLPLILGGVLGALLLVGGGLGGGYVLFGGDKPAEAGDPDAKGVDVAEASVPDLLPSSEVLSLGQFTVNLRDSAGGRLLQMEQSVECKGDAAKLVPEREAQLRDAILMLASDYSFLELDGAQGRMRLRDEIHRRINRVLAPAEVDRVYFTSFVVQ